MSKNARCHTASLLILATLLVHCGLAMAALSQRGNRLKDCFNEFSQTVGTNKARKKPAADPTYELSKDLNDRLAKNCVDVCPAPGTGGTGSASSGGSKYRYKK